MATASSTDHNHQQSATNRPISPARDKRLKLVGYRKSGYSGHIPQCIYYDRDLIPASIHVGCNLPPRGKMQLDGSLSPTQSMVREEQQRRERAAAAMAMTALRDHPTATRGSSAAAAAGAVGRGGAAPHPFLHSPLPMVPTVNEIGLDSHRSPKAFNTINSGVRDSSLNYRGSAPPSSGTGDRHRGVSVGLANLDIPMAALARPFTDSPTGRGHYASSDLMMGSDSSLQGKTVTIGGRQVAAAISPSHSPTSRYYRQMMDSEQQRTTSTGDGFNNNNNNIVEAPQRYRHVGAGGVCCGRTDPLQYGKFLHHDDKAIHGVETQLLPHLYSNGSTTHAMLVNKKKDGGADALLRSFGASSTNTTVHNNSNNNTSTMLSPTQRLATASAYGGTPFPRYPVLRGPNRIGPRGLETFLTN